MKIKVPILTVSMLLLCLVTYSDDHEMIRIDSLNNLIQKQTGPSRVSTLLALSEAYRLLSYDKSMKTGWDAIAYAEENGYHHLKATVLITLGQGAQQAGDYDLAKEYFKKSHDAYLKVNDNLGLAKVCNLMGVINLHTAEYSKAIIQFNESIDWAKKTNNDTLIVAATGNLGNAYFELGKLDQALDAFFQTRLMAGKIGDSLVFAKQMMHIGMVYWQWDENQNAAQHLKNAIKILERKNAYAILSNAYNNIGLIYLSDLKAPDTAQGYFEKALAIRERTGAPIPIANVLINLANVHLKKYNYVAAEPIYKRVLQIYQSSKHVQGIIRTCYHLGETYHFMKDYQKSNFYLELCLKNAAENNISQYNSIVTNILMENYIALNDFASFLKHFRTFKIEHDTLANQFNRSQVNESHLKYKIAEIEPQIEALATSNTLQAKTLRFYQYLSAAMVGILLLAILLFTILKKRISIN